MNRIISWLGPIMLVVTLGCQNGTDTTKIDAQYQQYCFACHGTGAAGAPRTGDSAAWKSRLKKGSDALLKSVTDGMVGMPAKGRCKGCTSEDLQALIEKMAR